MASGLTMTVLVENTPADGYACEHGLSVLVRHERLGIATTVLLDFGQSGAFAGNANALGADLASVDHAVLSHAHYDHADGMATFFGINDHAPLHLSAACAENCWSTKAGIVEPHYIGIRPGSLAAFAARLHPTPVNRTTTIAPGIHLVPHTTPGLEALGAHAGMLLRIDDAWVPDGFAHEQSLVFELGDEEDAPLAIFNSCSHAGLGVICREVQASFPGRDISLYVGGLHLMRSDDQAILAVADEIRAAGIGHVYTGHCTGDHAFELLANAMPGRISALRPGLCLTF
ncbi:MAG: MBL fold metallo-hydrolase [Atopobiaceae bacterium]|nr:MBL fold metallo-hydrolase [Atopobiaceae bacterium]